MFVVSKNMLVILISTILLFFSCNNHKNKVQSQQLLVDTVFKKTIIKSLPRKNIDTIDVKFDSFFSKFDSDRNFQLSRIKFPLKVKSDTEDGQSIKFIKKNEWRYTNFTHIKNIQIAKNSKTKNEIDLILSIIDTGVQVEYHFKIKNDQWWLYEITDRSD